MRNSFVLVGFCYLASLLGTCECTWAQARLTQAHAHNDYLHERPLADALDAGFNSVEADVYLVDGQLLVAHTAGEIKPDRSLQSLYLEPLKARVAANAGQVYGAGTQSHRPFWLLIDIKSEAESTYLRLHEVLESYADMLSRVEGEKVSQGAIQVVISGNRPQELIAAQAKRYCGIDGRISDLDSPQPAHLMPMISDNWGLQFRWRGAGAFPEVEQQKLLDVVERSHARGRVVRLWATPENENLWKVLVDSKVDFINTDQLKELSSFLKVTGTKQSLAKLSSEPPPAVAITESQWQGFTKESFQMENHSAFVVVPANPASGKPWIWRTSFPDFHAEVDRELVKHGFHIAYIDVVSMLGADPALDIMDRFYTLVRSQWGLAEKPALEPCSRGGLHAYRYAARHPERIACIFGDVPVMDLKSWPLKSSNAQGPMKDALKYYGFKNEAELNSFDGNPVDVLAPIAQARIPLRHIVSPNDTVVPPEENTLLAKQRLNQLGWDLEVVTVDPATTIRDGHHFPMIEIEKSLQFILRHASPK